jgi:predicted adenylyl cyclase CyaB
MHLNVEIKARCADAAAVRNYLLSHKADFKGTDYQTDTYFNVAYGRLKLRQGNIENSLIHYERSNQSGPKTSAVNMMKVTDGKTLHSILSSALGIMTEVVKKREIYFIENVKFHIDEVNGLGSFVEIEAIDFDGSLGEDRIREQCEYYVRELSIRPEDLLTHSYSDMLLAKAKQ